MGSVLAIILPATIKRSEGSKQVCVVITIVVDYIIEYVRKTNMLTYINMEDTFVH